MENRSIHKLEQRDTEEDTVKKSFGFTVRAWRRHVGLSQEELGYRAGLHRTYICDLERGTRNISLETIQKVAQALHVSMATLMSFEIDQGLTSPVCDWNRGPVDILLVEAQSQEIEVVTRALVDGAAKSRVEVARDGQEALNVLFGHDGENDENEERVPRDLPQVVLLDLILPKVDGVEVLRRMKRHPRTASIPVVVFTDSVNAGGLRASHRLGAVSYLLKPLSSKGLKETISVLRLQQTIPRR